MSIEVAVVGGGVARVALVSQRTCLVCDVVVTDAGDCKLFQTVGSANPAGVRYLGIMSNPLSWVQLVESCTAKVTKRAWEKVTSTSEMNSAVPLRTCDKVMAIQNRGWPKAATARRRRSWPRRS